MTDRARTLAVEIAERHLKRSAFTEPEWIVTDRIGLIDAIANTIRLIRREADGHKMMGRIMQKNRRNVPRIPEGFEGIGKVISALNVAEMTIRAWMMDGKLKEGFHYVRFQNQADRRRKIVFHVERIKEWRALNGIGS